MNKGILYGIAAYAFWGFFPIYWKLLQHVPAPRFVQRRVLVPPGMDEARSRPGDALLGFISLFHRHGSLLPEDPERRMAPNNKIYQLVGIFYPIEIGCQVFLALFQPLS